MANLVTDEVWHQTCHGETGVCPQPWIAGAERAPIIPAA
jgi:hypothetical protein